MTSAKLGDICTIVTGGTPSRSKSEYWSDGIIPWIKISDIKGKYVNKTDESITELGLEKSSAKLLRKGTILYTIFATLGEVGILNIDACTNQAIAGITINKNNNVTTNYLYYYMKSKKEYVNNIGRGVAQNNINLSILRQFEVPIPSAEEQRKIVSTLDKLQSIITHLRTQLEKLDLLVKARFVEMFGDVIANDKNWETKPLESVCYKIYGGGTPSKSHPEYYENGDIPWVSSKDMKNSIITDSKIHINELGVKNSTAKLVPANSVIMVIRSGILKHTLPIAINAIPITVNQDLKVLIPNDLVLSIFLANQIKMLEKDILSGVRAVTADNIEFNSLKQRNIIVPPLSLQTQFADFVKQVDKSRFVVQKELDKAQMLFDSLMQEYFG